MSANGPGEPDDDDAWLQTGAQLDADGKVVGQVRRPDVHARADELGSANEAPLELAERAPKPPEEPYDAPTYRDEADPGAAGRRRRRAALVAAAFMVLAIATLVAFGLMPSVQRHVPEQLNGHKPTMLIMSEPSGAAVRIGGKLVGQTPYAADNLYTGTQQLELSLPGYASFKASFEGDSPVQLSATLKKMR